MFGIGLVVLIASGLFRRHVQRELTNARLTGAPELEPEREDNQLLRTGMYAKIRHPRYLQILITLIGYSMMANHLAAYLTIPAYLVVIGPVIWLGARGGTLPDYADYRREVPWRFVPGLY